MAGQRDVTVADAAETARRTFLEVESAAIAYCSASPHHCTSSTVATPRIDRDVELYERVPAEQLPSR